MLLPRGGAWGEEASASVRSRGAEPIVCPLIGFEAVPIAPSLARLAAGGYAWVVVTSPRAAAALTDAAVPAATRIAAVGRATAAALRELGLEPAFVPAEESARGLLAEWPDAGPRANRADAHPEGGAGGADVLRRGRASVDDSAAPAEHPGRVLWPRSSEAAPTIREGLEALGHRVDDPVAYRTVPLAPGAEARERILAGEVDYALVTSGSVARALAAAVPAGTIPAVTIGPRTTREARAAGIHVRYEAADRNVGGMLDAIEQGREPEGE
ncbi:Uroporphyrinogen-III synthase [Gulosibacter sp. 10]|nr:Uroporphyrinogen-III synthase [Gulosibacter sp. 10]